MNSFVKQLNQLHIILASQSPRRYDLLKMVGLDFEVIPSNIIEKNHNDLEPLNYALTNARDKAAAISDKYPKSLVISADTIVVYNQHILEKPTDEAHAFEILSLLAGKTHEVITAFGYEQKKEGLQYFDYQRTKVTFRKLTKEEIQSYIKTGEPMDKAGGYGAQGLGSMIIEKVDGCFYNVVGFPLAKFFECLKKSFIEKNIFSQ